MGEQLDVGFCPGGGRRSIEKAWPLGELAVPEEDQYLLKAAEVLLK